MNAEDDDEEEDMEEEENRFEIQTHLDGCLNVLCVSGAAHADATNISSHAFA